MSLLDFYREWFATHLRLDLYVEVGFEEGSVWRRNIFDPPQLAAERVLRLRAEHPVHQSVARYRTQAPEDPLYPLVWVDIDAGGDPHTAFKEAAALVGELKGRYGCDAVLVRSPSKGVHVWVPLKRLLKHEDYAAVVSRLPLPPHTDTHIKDARKMARLPYTFKAVDGVRRYSYIVDRRGESIKHSEFGWSQYEPLDPTLLGLLKVDVEPRVVSLSPTPKVERRVAGVLAPCMVRLLEDCRRGVSLPHQARVALAAYLLNVGYTVDEVVEAFRAQPDFRESATRYQVNYIASYDDGEPLLPYSCSRMRNELNLCVAECGTKNPLNHNKTPSSYSQSRASSTGADPTSSVPSELSEFLSSTGLAEFSYEDFRAWLESRHGPLEASEWHRWERRLRLWAEEGFLGRKFLVDGEWVDYGPGKVARPPSKEVRFYKG